MSLLPRFIVSSISHHIGAQLSGRSAKSVAGRTSLSPQTLLQKLLQTSLYFRSIFAMSWLSLLPSLTSVPEVEPSRLSKTPIRRPVRTHLSHSFYRLGCGTLSCKMRGFFLVLNETTHSPIVMHEGVFSSCSTPR